MQRLESHMDLNSPKPGAFSITLQAATPSQIRKFPSPSVHLHPAAMPRFGQGVFSKAGKNPGLTKHRIGLWSQHIWPLAVLLWAAWNKSSKGSVDPLPSLIPMVGSHSLFAYRQWAAWWLVHTDMLYHAWIFWYFSSPLYFFFHSFPSNLEL